MASAQVVETSFNTNNSPSQDYTTNPDQARTQLFRRGVHFKLERISCQQSLKYISLYNTGGAPFSTKKRNIFLCT